MHYLTALQTIHSILRPQNYVEIGCRQGNSLTLASCPSLAIDPDFEIRNPLHAATRIYKQTSDLFFSQHNLKELLGGPVDLAFIDGLHNADVVLRDILNIESNSDANTVIVLDDVLPEDINWTTRKRHTPLWTGDVYKIIPFLREHRPDLHISVYDIEVKGIALIHNLDPSNVTLQGNLTEHCKVLSERAYELHDASSIRSELSPLPASDLQDNLRQLMETRRPLSKHETNTNVSLYLDLLKRSILNEIYMDDELRILYLKDCIDGKSSFSYNTLHNIRSEQPEALKKLKFSREIGQFPERNIYKMGFSHTMMGRLRLNSLNDCLDHILANEVCGDLIECGVWRGGACIFMAGWLRAHGEHGRRIFVADSFSGLPTPTYKQDEKFDLSGFPQLAVSEETVRENFSAYGLLDEHIHFVKGWFKDTLHAVPTTQIALLRLDGDLYESTMDILLTLYDKVVPGGIVIVDDYGALPVCREALEDFFAARGEQVPDLSHIDWTGAFFIKPLGKEKNDFLQCPS